MCYHCSSTMFCAVPARFCCYVFVLLCALVCIDAWDACRAALSQFPPTALPSPLPAPITMAEAKSTGQAAHRTHAHAQRDTQRAPRLQRGQSAQRHGAPATSEESSRNALCVPSCHRGWCLRASPVAAPSMLHRRCSVALPLPRPLLRRVCCCRCPSRCFSSGVLLWRCFRSRRCVRQQVPHHPGSARGLRDELRR